MPIGTFSTTTVALPMAIRPPSTGSARRVISVLFADLVGFTTLSEHLDPEDVATIQNDYFERARAAVEAAGGVVEKFIGDAVVAAFGVTHAGEDGGLRAVGAGLAIVAAVAEVGETLRLPAGSLQVRVGVNTGEVHASQEADGAWRLTGNVMNVAARLQTAADPGTVLIGAGTALAAEPAFVLRPVGGLDLKGKSEPVSAWHVVGPRDEPSRAGLLHGFTAPTLGRDQELASLLDSLTEPLEPKQIPSPWLVVAPPGVGKSRLVDELAARARQAGHPVWRATVVAHGGPYDVARALLREALDAAGEASLARAELVSGLTARGWSGTRGDLAADHALALVEGGPLTAEPDDLFASWAAVLEHRLGDVRTLWIIEDIHLLPPDVTGFVETLLRSTSTARSIVLTSRPGGVASVMKDGGMKRPLGDYRLLDLRPLGRDIVTGLVDALVGPGVVPPDAANGIADASGGNPLFVEELLRTWVQADVLRREAGAWRFTSSEGHLELPSTVHAIYQNQLDELHAATRQVATSGSVPGHTFPSGALDAFGVDEAEAGLDELRSLGLVAGPHLGLAALEVYTYRHTLLRDVAYASLPRMQRARLHVRFATWMDDRADRSLADELVGTHLAAAHASLPELADAVEVDGVSWDRERIGIEAADRLELAAERLVSHQPQRAVAKLNESLELDPHASAQVVARRSVGLGEALRRAGALDEAMRSFAHASVDLDVVPSAVLVRAALGYEDALFASRLPREQWGAVGIALIDAAIGSLDGEDAPVRARLLAAQGRALAYGGQPEAGARACVDAIEAADRLGDHAALASAIVSQRATQTGPDDLLVRLVGIERAVEAAARAGNREALLDALRLQFVDLLEAGRTNEASVVRQRAEALIEDLRLPVHLWYPAMWRAMDALRRGDASAETLVEAFRVEGEQWRYRDVRLVHAVQLLHLSVDTGEAARGLSLVESLLDEVGERFAPVTAYGAAAAGLDDRVADLVAVHAGSAFERLPRDLSWLYNVSLYADAAAHIGDVDSCRVLADQLLPWAGHLVVLGSGAVCLGDAGGFAGRAFAVAGDLERGRGLLREALEHNRATGCRPAADRVGAALDQLSLEESA